MTKFTLAIFLLLISFSTKAQSQSYDYAMFAGCVGAKLPGTCYNEKFRDDVTSLISPEITANLTSTLNKKYFQISFGFLSDENGKVLPETTEVICENQSLNDAVKQYILNLPAFIPKSPNNEDRRSAHLEFLIFIFNEQLEKYEAASQDRLKQEGIQTVFNLGTPPILANCSNVEKEKVSQCTQQELQRTIAKKISLSSIDHKFTGTIKLLGTFIVEKDGSITVKDVTCNMNDCDGLIKSFRKALKKMPEFIPGHYKGVKIRASYNLPITINITP